MNTVYGDSGFVLNKVRIVAINQRDIVFHQLEMGCDMHSPMLFCRKYTYALQKHWGNRPAG